MKTLDYTSDVAWGTAKSSHKFKDFCEKAKSNLWTLHFNSDTQESLADKEHFIWVAFTDEENNTYVDCDNSEHAFPKSIVGNLAEKHGYKIICND